MQFYAAEFPHGSILVPERLNEFSKTCKKRVEPSQLGCCQNDRAHDTLADWITDRFVEVAEHPPVQVTED